jgi:hypothetical protein
LVEHEALQNANVPPAAIVVMASVAGGRHLRWLSSRTSSSSQWLNRQRRDVYVKRAAEEGYCSRAAYKLIDLDRRYRLLLKGMSVVDLGAAPGGWTQVLAERVGSAKHSAWRQVTPQPLPPSPVQPPVAPTLQVGRAAGGKVGASVAARASLPSTSASSAQGWASTRPRLSVWNVVTLPPGVAAAAAAAAGPNAPAVGGADGGVGGGDAAPQHAVVGAGRTPGSVVNFASVTPSPSRGLGTQGNVVVSVDLLPIAKIRWVVVCVCGPLQEPVCHLLKQRPTSTTTVPPLPLHCFCLLLPPPHVLPLCGPLFSVAP